MKLWSGFFATALVAATMTGVASAQDQSDADYLKELQGKCRDGDSQSCFRLGGSFQLGLHQAKDLKGARRAYEMGCKDDSFSSLASCVEVYRMTSLGEGGPKDLKRAAELKERACNSGILIDRIELKKVGLCED